MAKEILVSGPTDVEPEFDINGYFVMISLGLWSQLKGASRNLVLIQNQHKELWNAAQKDFSSLITHLLWIFFDEFHQKEIDECTLVN